MTDMNKFWKDFNFFMAKILDKVFIYISEKHKLDIIVDIKVKLKDGKGFEKTIEKTCWSYPYWYGDRKKST